MIYDQNGSREGKGDSGKIYITKLYVVGFLNFSLFQSLCPAFVVDTLRLAQ